jgi:hypothetical protein
MKGEIKGKYINKCKIKINKKKYKADYSFGERAQSNNNKIKK